MENDETGSRKAGDEGPDGRLFVIEALLPGQEVAEIVGQGAEVEAFVVLEFLDRHEVGSGIDPRDGGEDPVPVEGVEVVGIARAGAGSDSFAASVGGKGRGDVAIVGIEGLVDFLFELLEFFGFLAFGRDFVFDRLALGGDAVNEEDEEEDG